MVDLKGKLAEPPVAQKFAAAFADAYRFDGLEPFFELTRRARLRAAA